MVSVEIRRPFVNGFKKGDYQSRTRPQISPKNFFDLRQFVVPERMNSVLHSICASILLLVGCSPSSSGPTPLPDPNSKASQLKALKLPKSEVKKLEFEQKNSDSAIYNGSDWFVVWADIEVSARSTNTLASSRRFRLYPKKVASGEQTAISPYTTRVIDDSDMEAWMTGRTKIESIEFLEA